MSNMTQQIKLRLGILELKKCYAALEELDFSTDVLNDLYDLIDDLEDKFGGVM